MHKRALSLLAAAAGMIAIMPGIASADTYFTGELQIADGAAFSADGVDFLPAGGTDGTFTVSDTSTDGFTAYIGTVGHIMDISSSWTVGSPISVPDFITLDAAPDLSLELTELMGGVFSSADCTAPAAIGQTCTPDDTFYNLVNTQTGATLSFDISGVLHNANGPDEAFDGIFTTQFTGRTYQYLLQQWAMGNSVQASYSGNMLIVTPVAEPTAWALMIVAFAGLGFMERRRASAARSC